LLQQEHESGETFPEAASMAALAAAPAPADAYEPRPLPFGNGTVAPSASGAVTGALLAAVLPQGAARPPPPLRSRAPDVSAQFAAGRRSLRGSLQAACARSR
jgi:hypothetical protein